MSYSDKGTVFEKSRQYFMGDSMVENDKIYMKIYEDICLYYEMTGIRAGKEDAR